MSAYDLEQEAQKYTGADRDILLNAAAIVRRAEQREEAYRDIERALESVQWFDDLADKLRRPIVETILKMKP